MYFRWCIWQQFWHICLWWRDQYWFGILRLWIFHPVPDTAFGIKWVNWHISYTSSSLLLLLLCFVQVHGGWNHSTILCFGLYLFFVVFSFFIYFCWLIFFFPICWYCCAVTISSNDCLCGLCEVFLFLNLSQKDFIDEFLTSRFYRNANFLDNRLLCGINEILKIDIVKESEF